jgi:arylsulfatase A-like enzyme
MNKGTTLLLAVLLLSPLATLHAADAPATKPNIIFIMFDDLGYGEPPSFRAGSQFKMPNLDKLAREGMRFTDAHSASSVCTPTRYGVMTGRYPWRIGQFGVLIHSSPPIIEPERMTVASLLHAQGYHTACFGKWHLGMNINGSRVANGPITRGFDTFCGYTEAHTISTVIENDRVLGTYQPVEVAPLLARKIVAHIDERAKAGAPFFLYVPLSQPHIPHVPAPEFQGKSGQEDYGDWILQGDAVVGQILDALSRHQLTTNTLVIVSSDNGAAGRVYPPLRDCKASIWEGGHREPFFARWPGKIKPGAVCHDTICHNDLLATCAEIVGAKLPDNAGEDSVSILPDLLDTATGPVREATVHQSMRGALAIRQGPWKLVFLANGKKELYNLKDDLSETKDLADAQPDVVARLTKLMQHYIDTGRSTPGAPQKNAVAVSLTGRERKKQTKNASADPE